MYKVELNIKEKNLFVSLTGKDIDKIAVFNLRGDEDYIEMVGKFQDIFNKIFKEING